MRNDTIPYVKIDTAMIGDYNPGNEYFAITIKGDCLNHDDCPMKIKDGDLLLCERVERRLFFNNWQSFQNEIILVVPCVPNSLNINHALVKQFVDIEHGLFLKMHMFNPDMTIELPIDEIKEISIIKKILQS